MATLPSKHGIVTVPVSPAPSHTKTHGIITVINPVRNGAKETSTDHGIVSK